MCVIACKPKGVSWLGSEFMKNCFTKNSDGAGLAWVDEEGLKVSKGYFKWEKLYKDMKVLEEYPVMLHCRLATHGSKNKQNCHPFKLKNGVIMAHNGIIDIQPFKEDMTDSETFGKTILEKFSVEELETPHIAWLIENCIGENNKISILKPDGNFLIYNKKCGVEHEGIWFSNNSFETVKYNYTYTLGYDDWYDICNINNVLKQQKKNTANRYVCDTCGDIHNIKDMFDVEGSIICDSCYKIYTSEEVNVTCDYCGAVVPVEETVSLYGGRVCWECSDCYHYGKSFNEVEAL